MNRQDERFLEALKAALAGESVSWQQPLTTEEWAALMEKAQEHHVLPLFLEAVYRAPAAAAANPALFAHFKGLSRQQVLAQTLKTADFLALYPKLTAAGVRPLVVKGLVCRALYPKPDCRVSGDEDLLLPPGSFPACHRALLANGLSPANPQSALETDYEIPYQAARGPLYLEVHKTLFPSDSEAYGEFNACFEGVFDRAVSVTVQGVPVWTLAPADHLFYLICHAFKHFLHSGFGLRQVCDLVQFAHVYGPKLDWEDVLARCRTIRADCFAATLFRIGERYLGFSPKRAAFPEAFRALAAEETALLADLLDSGVYGGARMSRRHSSTLTLNAVSAQKKGETASPHLLKTVFPSARALEGRYPYLKTKRYLLPVAWLNRLVQYRKETRRVEQNGAAEAVRIGGERIALLRQYGILDAKPAPSRPKKKGR